MRDYKERIKMPMDEYLHFEFEKYFTRMRELIDNNECDEDELLCYDMWKEEFIEREFGFEV